MSRKKGNRMHTHSTKKYASKLLMCIDGCGIKMEDMSG